ncbi:MAG: hypothetical protein WC277_11170 [Bacilli bacterium]|jgi:hypothetical protein
MAKVVRLSSPVEEICLSAENAIAYRRVLGVEKKDRLDTHVYIERELLEPFRDMPRGALTDAVNIGLNIVMVQRGML